MFKIVFDNDVILKVHDDCFIVTYNGKTEIFPNTQEGYNNTFYTLYRYDALTAFNKKLVVQDYAIILDIGKPVQLYFSFKGIHSLGEYVYNNDLGK